MSENTPNIGATAGGLNTRKVWPVDYRGAVVGVPIMCPKCGCKRVGVVHETEVRNGVKRRLRQCAHCGKQWSEYHVFEHTATADEWNMPPTCRYCGGLAANPVDKYGRESADGKYCSRACADAVHGFDNARESDGRHRAAAVELEAVPAPEPAAGDDGSLEKARLALEEMDRASAIDKRLPDILLRIKNGETQEQVAKRWGVDRSVVAKMIIRFRDSR